MADDETVRIDYIKSEMFRVVHADGVIGGPTPRGLIHFDIWSERQPIPRRMAFKVRDGKEIEEIPAEREVRADIVREVEVGITLDLALAKATVKWLEEQIAVVESMRAEIQKNRAKEQTGAS